MKLFQLIKLAIMTLFTLTVATAESKEMVHRLGVGFKNNTSVSIPSISATYFYSQDLAYTGAAGMDTASGNTRVQVNAGVRYILFFEPNMNAYITGQAGVLTEEDPVNGKASGMEVLAGGGVEFFFSGLENLGLCIEAGLGLSTARSTRIRTFADDPVRAGFTFYF